MADSVVLEPLTTVEPTEPTELAPKPLTTTTEQPIKHDQRHTNNHKPAKHFELAIVVLMVVETNVVLDGVADDVVDGHPMAVAMVAVFNGTKVPTVDEHEELERKVRAVEPEHSAAERELHEHEVATT